MLRRPVPKWQNLDFRAAAEGILSHQASLTHRKTILIEKGKILCSWDRRANSRSPESPRGSDRQLPYPVV